MRLGRGARQAAFVADAVAGLHVANGEDAHVKLDGLAHRVGAIRCWVDAMHSVGAGSCEVGSPVGSQEDAGGVGETARCGREFGAGCGEALALSFVQFVAGDFR